MKIVDINRETLPANTVFHFKNSTDRCIMVDYEGSEFDCLFVNLDEGVAFEWPDVEEVYDFEFYTKEDDEDFKGVNLEWS